MKQNQIEQPPPEKEKPGESFFSKIQIVHVPDSQDLTKAIGDAIVGKRKFAPLTCCGVLPCKGRLPGCRFCPLCMDCITGAGCSHPSSMHTPNEANTQ
jgi:hypothetical protein